MQSESQCRFCAKLPVVRNLRSGMLTRCPLCKGQLIEDRGAGTTYRYEEPSERAPQGKSLGRRLAALLGISATMVLVWLLVKPHAPETTIAAEIRPIAQVREIAQAEAMPPIGAPTNISVPADNAPRVAVAKPWVGSTEKDVRTKPPAGDTEIASKPYSSNDVAKGVAKNRPQYADGFYSRAKVWAFKFETPVPDKAKSSWATLTEKELLEKLQAIPELAAKLPAKREVGKKEFKLPEKSEVAKKESKLDHAAYLGELKRLNRDLEGLPFLLGDCQMPAEPAREFNAQVRNIRSGLGILVLTGDLDRLLEGKTTKARPSYATAPPDSYATFAEEEAAKTLAENQFNKITLEETAKTLKSALDRLVRDGASLSKGSAVAPLQQLTMDQRGAFRRALVSYLQEIPDKNATQALAKRAVFDFDSDIRDAAVRALRDRAAEDYAPVLLEALRYPWPAVPHHAARALVALQGYSIVPKLLEILEQPDPDLPFKEDGKTKIRELVRVNHNRNCLLCHAPSDSALDLVRATVPSPDRTLPRPFSSEYYSNRRTDSIFVRADVTYLRQDFSTPMEVVDHGPWPALQRYDFLVRVRELSNVESASFKEKRAEEPSEYKKAIVSVLRELTGVDAGTSAAAWRKRLGLPALVAKK